MPEHIIAFVKTLPEFIEAEYSETLIDEMHCVSYTEWCDEICETNNIPQCRLTSKYFDFDRLLIDEWNTSASNGGDEYYLITQDKKGNLCLWDNEEADDCLHASLSWCWVVRMPTH